MLVARASPCLYRLPSRPNAQGTLQITARTTLTGALDSISWRMSREHIEAHLDASGRVRGAGGGREGVERRTTRARRDSVPGIAKPTPAASIRHRSARHRTWGAEGDAKEED